MQYLRAKHVRPAGWYWTGGDGNWAPARYSVKGWEPALAAGVAYFTDDEVGEIGPFISLPTRLNAEGADRG